jgi:hypothetical protein
VIDDDAVCGYSDLARDGLLPRFLGAATVVGIGSMLTVIALGSRQQIIGLAALIVLSIVIYLAQTRSAAAPSH